MPKHSRTSRDVGTLRHVKLVKWKALRLGSPTPWPTHCIYLQNLLSALWKIVNFRCQITFQFQFLNMYKMSTTISTNNSLPYAFRTINNNSALLLEQLAVLTMTWYVNDTFTEITLDQGRSWGSPEIELNWFICQRLPAPLNFPNLFTYGEEERKIRN